MNKTVIADSLLLFPRNAVYSNRLHGQEFWIFQHVLLSLLLQRRSKLSNTGRQWKIQNSPVGKSNKCHRDDLMRIPCRKWVKTKSFV